MRQIFQHDAWFRPSNVDTHQNFLIFILSLISSYKFLCSKLSYFVHLTVKISYFSVIYDDLLVKIFRSTTIESKESLLLPNGPSI